MSVCPVCQQTIEILDKHYGALFTCPHCQAVYFVGWDGQPESAPEHEPLAPAEPVPDEMSGSLSPAYVPEPEPEGVAPLTMHVPDSDAPAADPQAVEEEPQWNPVSDPQPEVPFEASSSEEPLPVASELADVADYANADQSATGPLTYTIHIRGLELAETFEKLREALIDSRFAWDVDEVMGRVRGGELVLSGLNPTKAAILVGRIKYLPIELEWTQEVFGGNA